MAGTGPAMTEAIKIGIRQEIMTANSEVASDGTLTGPPEPVRKNFMDRFIDSIEWAAAFFVGLRTRGNGLCRLGARDLAAGRSAARRAAIALFLVDATAVCRCLGGRGAGTCRLRSRIGTTRGGRSRSCLHSRLRCFHRRGGLDLGLGSAGRFLGGAAGSLGLFGDAACLFFLTAACLFLGATDRIRGVAGLSVGECAATRIHFIGGKMVQNHRPR